MPNSLKFGTSGLRGLATDLVGAESRRYAAAFVAYLKTLGPVGEVLVGRDLRASSPEISAAVIGAIGATGASASIAASCPPRRWRSRRCGARLRRSWSPAAIFRPTATASNSTVPLARSGKADEAGILAALACRSGQQG